MPSQTFHNLPDDKRRRFVHAARDLFAQQPYDQASIGAMVRDLGIAKGSVYQYFGGKLDLFAWLVEQAGKRKARWFEDRVVPAHDDPFEQLAEGYRQGLRYWRDEPEWNRIALRVRESSVEPGLVALRRAQDARVVGHLAAWIATHQQSGALRSDLDPELSARLMRGLLGEGLLDAFLAALGTDVDRFVADAPRLSDDALEAALQVADPAIDVLRRAWAAR